MQPRQALIGLQFSIGILLCLSAFCVTGLENSQAPWIFSGITWIALLVRRILLGDSGFYQGTLLTQLDEELSERTGSGIYFSGNVFDPETGEAVDGEKAKDSPRMNYGTLKQIMAILLISTIAWGALILPGILQPSLTFFLQLMATIVIVSARGFRQFIIAAVISSGVIIAYLCAELRPFFEWTIAWIIALTFFFTHLQAARMKILIPAQKAPPPPTQNGVRREARLLRSGAIEALVWIVCLLFSQWAMPNRPTPYMSESDRNAGRIANQIQKMKNALDSSPSATPAPTPGVTSSPSPLPATPVPTPTATPSPAPSGSHRPGVLGPTPIPTPAPVQALPPKVHALVSTPIPSLAPNPSPSPTSTPTPTPTPTPTSSPTPSPSPSPSPSPTPTAAPEPSKPSPDPLVRWLKLGGQILLALLVAYAVLSWLRKLGLRRDPRRGAKKKLSKKTRRQILAAIDEIAALKLSPEEEVIRRYTIALKVLDAANRGREPYLPPVDYSRRMSELFPPLSVQFGVLCETFCDAFYGKLKITPAQLKEYRAAFQEVTQAFL